MHFRTAIAHVVLPVVAVVGCVAGAAAEQSEVRTGAMPHLMIDRQQSAAFRSDTVELKLAPAKSPGWQLEYMVGMKSADALVYSLTADAAVTLEFHSEEPSSKTLMFHREEKAIAVSHGQFVAPIDGVHGWYLANTTDKPVTVRLKLSGYYTLPSGSSSN
jgi:hypothetical protein